MTHQQIALSMWGLVGLGAVWMFFSLLAKLPGWKNAIHMIVMILLVWVTPFALLSYTVYALFFA